MKREATVSEPMTDTRIVQLYLERNTRAITETDKKYGRLLYHVAYQLLHDHGDSEECQNDTYLGAWNAIPPAKPAVLRTFLAKITRRLAISRYRERHAKKQVPSELTASLEELEYTLHSKESVTQAVDAKLLGEAIDGFLRTLPEQKRFLFLGRYYFAQPVKELAAQIGTTDSNVYKQLTGMKEELRVYLTERGMMP